MLSSVHWQTTEREGCWRSTRARRCSGLSDLTCPLRNPAYLELADVLVELGNEGLIRFFLPIPVSTEKSSGPLHQGSFPAAYLAGVDLEPVGNFHHGLLTFQGLQGHLGLECWAVLLTTLLHLLLLHVSSVILGAGPDLKHLSGIWGPSHYLFTLQQEDTLDVLEKVPL